jgi:hypothetical protein
MIGQLAAMDSRTTVSQAGIDFEASQRKTKRLVEFNDVSCEVPSSDDASTGTLQGENGPRLLFSGLEFHP